MSTLVNCPEPLTSLRDRGHDRLDKRVAPAELSRDDSPFRLQRRDQLALQTLLGAFWFMATMNVWNLLTALFR